MDSTQDLNVFSAWGFWFAGHALAEMSMYGIRMLIWSRIGKILEFLGGAMILVDIIGREILRALGASIREFRNTHVKLAKIAHLANRHAVGGWILFLLLLSLGLAQSGVPPILQILGKLILGIIYFSFVLFFALFLGRYFLTDAL
jgi:hypothetical protein